MIAVWLRRVVLGLAWAVALFYSIMLSVSALEEPSASSGKFQVAILAGLATSFVLSVARSLVDLPSSALPRAIARPLAVVLAGRGRYAFLAAMGLVFSVAMSLLWFRDLGSGADGVLAAVGMLSGALFGDLLGRLPARLLKRGKATNDPEAPRLELRAPNGVARAIPPAAFLVTLAVMAATRWAGHVDLVVQLYLSALWGMFVILMWAPRAELGADGVYIWGINRRFIPFVGRESARTRLTGIDISRDGKVLVRLRVLGERDFLRRDRLIDRIRSMLATGRARIGPANAAIALTDRRDATSGETDYRSAGVSRDDLWRVVETPVAPARARIEAARELATAREQDDAARFRAAAEATADPETREKLLDATVRRSS